MQVNVLMANHPTLLIIYTDDQVARKEDKIHSSHSTSPYSQHLTKVVA
jgi:hypothetical protein